MQGDFAVAEKAQGDPPGKEFGLRKRGGNGQAVVAGDPVGIADIALGKQLAGLKALFDPPFLRLNGRAGDGQQQGLRLVVAAFLAPPFDALVNQAGIVAPFFRNAGDGGIDPALTGSQADAGIGDAPLQVIDAGQHAAGGAIVAAPDQTIQTGHMIFGQQQGFVLAQEGAFLAGGKFPVDPGIAQTGSRLLLASGRQQQFAVTDHAAGG